MKKEITKEKRVVRTYKIKKSVYERAMKKAVKNKKRVANLLEDFLYDYAE